MIQKRELAKFRYWDRRRQEITEATGPYGKAVLSWSPGMTDDGSWTWTVRLNDPPPGFKAQEYTSPNWEGVEHMLATGTLPWR